MSGNGRKRKSNIGDVGVDSIRLGGMTVDELPIAEAHLVKMQLPGARELERTAKIAGVRARYPQQDVGYLEARIREAKGMIATFRQQRDGVRSQREQYGILLTEAEKRDKEIAHLADDDIRDECVKALREEYGPWEVEGLRNQITLFDESVARFDETIEREQASIDELSEVLGLCRARDKEIARLGERTN